MKSLLKSGPIAVTLATSHLGGAQLHASLVGDSVDSSIVPPAIWNVTPGSAVVGPGPEFAYNLFVGVGVFETFFEADLDAASILLSMVHTGGLQAGADEFITWSDLDWVGDPASVIFGVNLTTAGATGIDPSDVTFTDHSVVFDVNQGALWTEGSWARIDLKFSSVPDDMTTSVPAGLALLSLLLLRRRLASRQP